VYGCAFDVRGLQGQSERKCIGHLNGPNLAPTAPAILQWAESVLEEWATIKASPADRTDRVVMEGARAAGGSVAGEHHRQYWPGF
jgi:hypothetical protein